MVSPWRVKCGIYAYTRNLSEALAELGVDVYVVRLPRFGVLTPDLIQACVADKAPLEADVIHVQEEYGRFQNLEGAFYGALSRLRKPVVTTMHATGNFRVDQVVAGVSRKVIVHNEFCASRFGFPEKTVIIPHGCVKGECLPKEEARKALGVPGKARVVGYLGFISPNKGLETLIEALLGLPDVALLVGGGWFVDAETEYIESLRRRSLELLKGRCLWLGYVPDGKLPAAFGAMDMFVYPSRFTSESGAVLTALGFSRATLTSRLPPFQEKEKHGALMTFTDSGDLTEKVRLLFNDASLRRRLEEAASRYAATHSWRRVAEEHARLYRSII